MDDKNSLYLLYCGIKGIAPGDQGRPSGGGGAGIPEQKISPIVKNFLPYLADCSDQEYYLQEAIQGDAGHTPVAIVVHGDEYQCLEKFRERLEKVSLPRLMQLNEDQEVIKSYSISWPTRISNLDEFEKRLVNSLSNAVLRQGMGSREIIQQTLAQHPVPVLVHSTLLSSEWKRFGDAIVDQYMQFWEKWPQLAPRQRLLVFLFVKYESKYSKRSLLSKPFNDQIETYLKTFDFSKYLPLRGIVLPRLNGVSRAEAEDWARSDAVKAFCDSDLVIREIREWYEKEVRDPEKPMVPMERLAELLKRFLDTNKIFQESA